MSTLNSDLYLLLWRDSATSTCRTNSVRNTLGCLPDCHDRVRVGGPPCEFERISHKVSRESTVTRSSYPVTSICAGSLGNLSHPEYSLVSSPGLMSGVGRSLLQFNGYALLFYCYHSILISQIWPIPIIFVCIFCPESPTWRE
jgi:hypothetical protein